MCWKGTKSSCVRAEHGSMLHKNIQQKATKDWSSQYAAHPKCIKSIVFHLSTTVYILFNYQMKSSHISPIFHYLTSM